MTNKTTKQDSTADANCYEQELIHGDNIRIFSNSLDMVAIVCANTNSMICIDPCEADFVCQMIRDCSQTIMER